MINEYSKPIFRCSSLGGLMSGISGPGETAYGILRKMAFENKYGIRKRFSSKPTAKGIENEGLSIEMAARAYGWDVDPNKPLKYRKVNEFITGEPDVVTQLVLADVKSSFEAESFPSYDLSFTVSPNKAYEWQMQGYMWLFDRSEAELVYVLTPMPEQMLLDQIRRDSYLAMSDPRYAGMGMEAIEEMVDEQLRAEVDFEVIPEEKRIRRFIIQRDERMIQQIQVRCRQLYPIYERIFNAI